MVAGILATGLAALGTIATAPAALAVPGCDGTPQIWVSSWSLILRSYTVDNGDLVRGTDLSVSYPYGNIALTPDGVLYGVRSVPVDTGPPHLVTISTSTGAELSDLPITFAGGGTPPAPLSTLSAAPDGTLYVGSWNSGELWSMDPATAVITRAVTTYPKSSSGHQLRSAGDALTLADGDLLVLAVAGIPAITGQDFYALRVNPATGGTTVIGSIPWSWAAALSGGVVYMAGTDGVIRTLDSIPTAPSESPLPYTEVEDPLMITMGAASVEDAGTCQLPTLAIAEPRTLPPTGPAAIGPILGAAVLLLAVGGGVLLVRRRRPTLEA